MKEKILKLLKQTTKPYRYVGGEEGSIKKDLTKVELKTCLMFPDMYEVAISNLGHRILYHILNKKENFLCDRTYAPSSDFLGLLEKNNLSNILAIVVRYFGGIKLGAGGLVRAYTKSVTNTLSEDTIISLTKAYNVDINNNTGDYVEFFSFNFDRKCHACDAV